MKKSNDSVNCVDLIDRIVAAEREIANLTWRIERIERLNNDMALMTYYDAAEREIARRKRASKRASK